MIDAVAQVRRELEAAGLAATASQRGAVRLRAYAMAPLFTIDAGLHWDTSGNRSTSRADGGGAGGDGCGGGGCGG